MFGFEFSKKDQLLKILKNDIPISFIHCNSCEEAIDIFIKYLKEGASE